jgi:predicted nucleotidyltransferase
LLNDKRQEILDLAEKHGVYNVRVFGSIARGEARMDSDVDFLVDVQPGVGLGFLTLWNELEDLLGRKIDLVPEESLRENLRERVIEEAVPL